MANKLSHQIPVFFTQAQVQWLEQAFPESYHLAPADELAYRAGQRSVVQAVKGKVGAAK